MAKGTVLKYVSPTRVLEVICRNAIPKMYRRMANKQRVKKTDRKDAMIPSGGVARIKPRKRSTVQEPRQRFVNQCEKFQHNIFTCITRHRRTLMKIINSGIARSSLVT